MSPAGRQRPVNDLIVMADEYMARALGAVGHEVVCTPVLDGLAARGTRFVNAYTPSPMCVPARAAFQTGLYVHQLRCWDSAQPYRGDPPGWGHALRARGREVASVGKLHFRSGDDDNGFRPEMLPLHVHEGRGWVPGLLRRNPMAFDASGYAGSVGRGGSDYTRYDRRITDAACRWLRERPAHAPAWTLFVSLVSPHYPLNAPAPYYDLYDEDEVDLPVCYAPDERPVHPAVRHVIEASGYDRHFRDERHVRRARVAYYGLCSYVDALLGELLAALDASGISDRTRVWFTSDHGEMLGNHGTWTKMVMYEDSVKVPLLVAGPEVARGHEVHTPVSLVDVAPTLLGAADIDGCGLAGESLLNIAAQGTDPTRTAFSEYHDGWSASASFMVRWDRWKLVHHVGFAPQLFDLQADPLETIDRAGEAALAGVLDEGRRRLLEIVDPAAVDAQAFRDQAAAIAAHGGEAAIRLRHDDFFDYTPLPGC